jgi:predicted TIM-barrel fold metal-dependent hydrolase
MSNETTHAQTLDVHHHFLPPGYLGALERAGVPTSSFPEWSIEGSLRAMDRLGVGRALLSLSSPGAWLENADQARSLARECNRYAAEVIAQHPDRFGALAALPFPDVQGSIEEARHALDGLGLEGVILLSNVDGTYVGDPELEPLMAELDSHGALVLLHPNAVQADDEHAALHGWIEYPDDVARAFGRLLCNDVLVRYPNIRWVLAHGGGVVPFVADRMSRAYYAKGRKPRWGRILHYVFTKRNVGLELAQQLGYDSVGVDNPATLAALRRLTGPDGIRFGSNFPWDDVEVAEETLRTIRAA